MTQSSDLALVMPTLVQAIKGRQRVMLRYRDQEQEREIEPHAIYTDERDELVLDAFQVGGFSESARPLPYWRPLRVKKIRTLRITKQGFAPRVQDGFSSSRLKYKHGLLAIVETPRAAFEHVLSARNEETGPPRPPILRR